MDEELTTEAENPRTRNIDHLPAADIMALMQAEDAGVAEAVGRENGAIGRAVVAIAERLRTGGRLIYLGAGTSGRLGVLDAAECPPTFGTPPERVRGLIAGGMAALERSIEGAEDRPALAEADVEQAGVGEGDVLVAISASGRTPYTLAGLRRARERGAFTVALCCNRNAPLSEAAHLRITPVVGPEVLAGSTRLKAGTATKLVLNRLSTGAMILLGHTSGNLMAGVQTACAKLQRRARNILRQRAGVDEAEAGRLLALHDDNVQAALRAVLPVYHLMEEPDWLCVQTQESHAPPSLAEEGFVHLSLAEQVAASANRHHADSPALVALEIDPRRLACELRFEESRGHGVFPHLYGPLSIEAVRCCRNLSRDAAGRWSFPDPSHEHPQSHEQPSSPPPC